MLRQNPLTNHTDTFGYANKMSISHLTNHLIVNYEGNACPSEHYRNRTVNIFLECSPFADLEPTLVEETECDLIIKWPVKSACVSTPDTKSQCKFYYAGNYYDLTPLSHMLDSWRLELNGTSYWVNVCQGVLNGPQNCPATASACVANHGAAEVLSYTDQMHLEVKKDGTLIEMAYNNSRRVCEFDAKSNTFVLIRFVCGTTMGKIQVSASVENKPEYMIGVASQCITLFEWSTRYACRNSALFGSSSKVNLTDGIVYDSTFSHIKIDMRDVFEAKKAFFDKTDIRQTSNDSFEYSIQFAGANSIGECKNALVCQLDVKSKTYRDLGSRINSLVFDVYAQILEVSIATNVTPCNANNYTESLIRFYCDSSATGDRFNFETVSPNCVFLFDWPTPKLCVRDTWLKGRAEIETIRGMILDSNSNTTTLVTPATASASTTTTITTTATTKSNSKKESIAYKASQVPAFVYLLVLLILVVMLVVLLNNLGRIVEFRLWSNLNACCFKLKTEVNWFGTSTRRARTSPLNHIRGIKYNKRASPPKTYIQMTTSDKGEKACDDDDEEEITALIDFDDKETLLKLKELPQHAHKASSRDKDLVSELEMEDPVSYLPRTSKVTRQDSRNNMLSVNTDTDDDLINV